MCKYIHDVCTISSALLNYRTSLLSVLLVTLLLKSPYEPPLQAMSGVRTVHPSQSPSVVAFQSEGNRLGNGSASEQRSEIRETINYVTAVYGHTQHSVSSV